MKHTTPPVVNVLASDHLQRRHAGPLRYAWPTRLMDRRSGIIDGILDQRTGRIAWGEQDSHQVVHGDGRQGITMWLSRLEHSFREMADHEHLTARAIEASHQARSDLLLRRIEDLIVEVSDAEIHRAGIPDSPDEQELTRRGPAERLDSVAVLTARRRSEHHRRAVAPADARIQQLRTNLADARAELAELNALILTARDIAVIRVMRLMDFHERRAGVYRRAWMQSWQRGPRAREAGHVAPIAMRAVSVLEVPHWVVRHQQLREQSRPTNDAVPPPSTHLEEL